MKKGRRSTNIIDRTDDIIIAGSRNRKPVSGHVTNDPAKSIADAVFGVEDTGVLRRSDVDVWINELSRLGYTMISIPEIVYRVATQSPVKKHPLAESVERKGQEMLNK